MYYKDQILHLSYSKLCYPCSNNSPQRDISLCTLFLCIHKVMADAASQQKHWLTGHMVSPLRFHECPPRYSIWCYSHSASIGSSVFYISCWFFLYIYIIDEIIKPVRRVLILLFSPYIPFLNEWNRESLKLKYVLFLFAKIKSFLFCTLNELSKYKRYTIMKFRININVHFWIQTKLMFPLSIFIRVSFSS